VCACSRLCVCVVEHVVVVLHTTNGNYPYVVHSVSHVTRPNHVKTIKPRFYIRGDMGYTNATKMENM